MLKIGSGDINVSNYVILIIRCIHEVLDMHESFHRNSWTALLPSLEVAMIKIEQRILDMTDDNNLYIIFIPLF